MFVDLYVYDQILQFHLLSMVGMTWNSQFKSDDNNTMEYHPSGLHLRELPNGYCYRFEICHIICSLVKFKVNIPNVILRRKACTTIFFIKNPYFILRLYEVIPSVFVKNKSRLSRNLRAAITFFLNALPAAEATVFAFWCR